MKYDTRKLPFAEMNIFGLRLVLKGTDFTGQLLFHCQGRSSQMSVLNTLQLKVEFERK